MNNESLSATTFRGFAGSKIMASKIIYIRRK